MTPASVLQSGDLYYNPSRTETFGLAVVEAVACGLPTMITAAGALRELADASAVTQTKVDDVQQLAGALPAGMDAQLERDPERSGAGLTVQPTDRRRANSADLQCDRLG